MNHDLKTWPEYFEAVLSGEKTFEVRKEDRPFAYGDTVTLLEYSPIKGFSGRRIEKRICYHLPGGMMGLPEGLCVFGLGEIKPTPCKVCDGTGEAYTPGYGDGTDGHDFHRCKRCHGTGRTKGDR